MLNELSLQILGQSPWPFAILTCVSGVGILSWLLTLKVFVTTNEHQAYKTQVAQQYMQRQEVTQQLQNLQEHLNMMQRQLQHMQTMLFKLCQNCQTKK